MGVMSSGPEAGDVFVRVADMADVAVRPGVQQADADCGKAYKVACYQHPKSSRLTACGRW